MKNKTEGDKIKVYDINTAKPIMIDPLVAEKHKLYSWKCHRCGQTHKATYKPKIFDMTENGLVSAHCLKDI